MSRRLVIKLGGTLIDNKPALQTLFNLIKQVIGTKELSIMIVHGGGKKVDQLLCQLSLPVIRQAGLRVTPSEQIDIIVGCLAGTANTELLAAAKKMGIDAIGLCLADGDSCYVSQLSAELGHVGHAKSGNAKLINLLLNESYLPIVSSIGLDENCQIMNVNADHAAVAFAQTFNADLLLLSDVSGVFDENKQLISSLNYQQAAKLIAQGIIIDGMAIKVQSAFQAAQELGRDIIIASGQDNPYLMELFNGITQNAGTRIVA